MKKFVKADEVKPTFGKGHYSYNLLGEANGCVNGCAAGISVYVTTEYAEPGVHDDQEGFLVLEGSGHAKVADEEFLLEKDVSFIVPAGVKHAIKCKNEQTPVKVFWFHSSVESN